MGYHFVGFRFTLFPSGNVKDSGQPMLGNKKIVTQFIASFKDGEAGRVMRHPLFENIQKDVCIQKDVHSNRGINAVFLPIVSHARIWVCT